MDETKGLIMTTAIDYYSNEYFTDNSNMLSDKKMYCNNKHEQSRFN